MQGKIQVMIVALCLLASGASRAADSWEGYPIYGGFALGFVAASDTNCDYYGYNCDGTDLSFKIYAGKQFHNNLAVELGYYDLGKLKNKGSLVTTTAESQGFNLSLLGMIPVQNVGFFYGKAGAMVWEADYTRIGTNITTSSGSGTDFTYGAGFAYRIGNNYDFRIEYERLNELGNDYVGGGSTISVFNFAGTIYFN
jgi:OOP family OmpA-OmpF porin